LLLGPEAAEKLNEPCENSDSHIVGRPDFPNRNHYTTLEAYALNEKASFPFNLEGYSQQVQKMAGILCAALRNANANINDVKTQLHAVSLGE
jgi:hypothetical protein